MMERVDRPMSSPKKMGNSIVEDRIKMNGDLEGWENSIHGESIHLDSSPAQNKLSELSINLQRFAQMARRLRDNTPKQRRGESDNLQQTPTGRPWTMGSHRSILSAATPINPKRHPRLWRRTIKEETNVTVRPQTSAPVLNSQKPKAESE
jgi:hypothetical protein